MKTPAPKILVVDDERDLLMFSRTLLEGAGYHVKLAEGGKEALRLLQEFAPDLIIMDVMMPGLDGLATCEAIRAKQHWRHIPVIFRSAKNEIHNRINAFKKGADDFLAKPCDPEELLVRIAAKLHRPEEGPGKAVFTCGDLVLNRDVLSIALKDGTVYRLTSHEFKILYYLASNRGRILSRAQILDKVWGNTAVTDRTVDTHIKKLRHKLKHSQTQIVTVYGAGYLIE